LRYQLKSSDPILRLFCHIKPRNFSWLICFVIKIRKRHLPLHAGACKAQSAGGSHAVRRRQACLNRPFPETTVDMLLEFEIKSCSCINKALYFFV
jgi:hypothetical protein